MMRLMSSGGELYHAAVVGHQAVELAFHVGELGVYRGGEAVHAGGPYLPVVEQRQRAAEFLLAVEFLVAEGLPRPRPQR